MPTSKPNNMKMHRIKITQEELGGHLTMYLDGEKNPLTIAAEPVLLEVSRGGVPMVRVAIICEKLELDADAGVNHAHSKAKR